MGGKDGCKGRLEAATKSDILYLFGQGNFIFIRKKSGKSEGIMKTHACGNHGLATKICVARFRRSATQWPQCTFYKFAACNVFFTTCLMLQTKLRCRLQEKVVSCNSAVGEVSFRFIRVSLLPGLEYVYIYMYNFAVL